MFFYFSGVEQKVEYAAHYYSGHQLAEPAVVNTHIQQSETVAQVQKKQRIRKRLRTKTAPAAEVKVAFLGNEHMANTPVVEEQPVPEDPLDVEDQPDEEGVFTETMQFTPVFPMREMNLEQADIEAVAETMRARLDTGVINPHILNMNEALDRLQMRRYNPNETAQQPLPTLDELRTTIGVMRDNLTPVQPYTTIVTPDQMPMTPEEAEAEEIRQAEELGVL